MELLFRYLPRGTEENYEEKHNSSLKVAVQGLDFMAHPLYIQNHKEPRPG
jgi:hypothetical protein